VWTMKFNHDGRYLATAGQDRVVRVWELDLIDGSGVGQSSDPSSPTDSESEDNETPTKETRRQLTLNDTLNDTEQEGTPNENTPGPSGFFHFVSRESRGDESVSANVGNVGEDQLRLVDSIHALLSEVEVERGRAKTALEKTKERVASLERTNAELERRLAGRREMGKASNETSANRDSDTESDDSNSGHDDSYIDEDAWSDDEVGTPVRKRGFLSSLNPFGRRR
ncbi:WD40 domain-containing protein, partial [bacterium]|nr:WD40 domain-containing protein [bacterium]